MLKSSAAGELSLKKEGLFSLMRPHNLSRKADRSEKKKFLSPIFFFHFLYIY